MLSAVAPADANIFASIWRDFNRSYHRNRCWPHPFVDADNMAVRAPFAAMIENGWRLQNMVGSHHFDPNTLALNEAGRRHVHWVLTQAPVHHRIVYVERALTEQETAARYASVQRHARHFTVPGQPLDIRISDVMAQGWPADYADAVNVKFRESTPDPRLPTQSQGFKSE
jgi:hypothetical protein